LSNGSGFLFSGSPELAVVVFYSNIEWLYAIGKHLIDLETGLYLLPNPNICITAVGFASRVNQMLVESTIFQSSLVHARNTKCVIVPRKYLVSQ